MHGKRILTTSDAQLYEEYKNVIKSVLLSQWCNLVYGCVCSGPDAVVRWVNFTEIGLNPAYLGETWGSWPVIYLISDTKHLERFESTCILSGMCFHYHFTLEHCKTCMGNAIWLSNLAWPANFDNLRCPIVWRIWQCHQISAFKPMVQSRVWMSLFRAWRCGQIRWVKFTEIGLNPAYFGGDLRFMARDLSDKLYLSSWEVWTYLYTFWDVFSLPFRPWPLQNVHGKCDLTVKPCMASNFWSPQMPNCMKKITMTSKHCF